MVQFPTCRQREGPKVTAPLGGGGSLGGYRCGPGGVAERAERGEGLVHDGAPPAVVRRDLAVAPGEHRGAGRRGAGRRPGQDGAIRTRQFDSAPAELHRRSLLGRFVFALGGWAVYGTPWTNTYGCPESDPVTPSHAIKKLVIPTSREFLWPFLVAIRSLWAAGGKKVAEMA